MERFTSGKRFKQKQRGGRISKAQVRANNTAHWNKLIAQERAQLAKAKTDKERATLHSNIAVWEDFKRKETEPPANRKARAHRRAAKRRKAGKIAGATVAAVAAAAAAVAAARHVQGRRAELMGPSRPPSPKVLRLAAPPSRSNADDLEIIVGPIRPPTLANTTASNETRPPVFTSTYGASLSFPFFDIPL